ncbi:MAG: hypothetical protein U0235_06440 [Polyangiaceae bacterium]
MASVIARTSARRTGDGSQRGRPMREAIATIASGEASPAPVAASATLPPSECPTITTGAPSARSRAASTTEGRSRRTRSSNDQKPPALAAGPLSP